MGENSWLVYDLVLLGLFILGVARIWWEERRGGEGEDD